MSVKETIEVASAAASAAVAHKVTVASGIGVSLAGFLTHNALGLLGLLMVVVSYLTNLYFQKKTLRMREREHIASMKEKGMPPISDLDQGV